jgi:hypothetical protein
LVRAFYNLGSEIKQLTVQIAFTKNGLMKLAAAPAPDLSKFKTDKKIEDEGILKILEQPLARSTGSKSKNKKKKKKPAKKAAQPQEDDDDDEDSDDE